MMGTSENTVYMYLDLFPLFLFAPYFLSAAEDHKEEEEDERDDQVEGISYSLHSF